MSAPEVTVLLVEDEWLLRFEIAEELRRLGWDVEEAASGEDALRYLDEGKPVDFLVTDIRLGGPVTGWDVAEAFRKRDPALPVVYVSANVIVPERKVPGSAFFSKPCDLTALLDTCRSLQAQSR